MCRHAGRFTVGVLAGAVYLAGGFSFSPAAQAEPPNFAPNPNVRWYSLSANSFHRRAGQAPCSRTRRVRMLPMTNTA